MKALTRGCMKMFQSLGQLSSPASTLQLLQHSKRRGGRRNETGTILMCDNSLIMIALTKLLWERIPRTVLCRITVLCRSVGGGHSRTTLKDQTDAHKSVYSSLRTLHKGHLHTLRKRHLQHCVINCPKMQWGGSSCNPSQLSAPGVLLEDINRSDRPF